MAPAESRIDPALQRMANAIIVGAMAIILNTTIVSVALPTLGEEFHVGLGTIQWVTTGYLLAMFAVIPLTGWLQARFGGKHLWLASLTVFTVGSALGAASWNAASLIAFRVLAGLGGGIAIPLMATLLMQAAGGKNVGRLMASVGLPAALGPIMGPVVGGVILTYAPWEWLFLVNVPFGVIGFWLAMRYLPHDKPSTPARLDGMGAVLSIVGIVTLIYGLTNVAADGGFVHANVILPASIGALLIAAYCVYALRLPTPAIIDIRLLKHRELTVSTLLMFISGIALYGAMFLLPLFYQELRGKDALATGLLLIPQGVGSLLSRAVAGRLTDTIGPRWVAVVGFAVVALGTAPFAFSSVDTGSFALGVVLFVRGLGMGAVLIPLMTTAYVGLRHHEIPDASIVTRVGQQLGGSVGVAMLAVVLTTGLTGALSMDDAAAAFDATFWWATGATGVGALLSLLLPARGAKLDERTMDDVIEDELALAD